MSNKPDPFEKYMLKANNSSANENIELELSDISEEEDAVKDKK